MSSNQTVRVASLTPTSRASSVFSESSTNTLVAGQGYRGFPSEEAYLQAMREWVDSKMYYESEEQLKGFYGTKTAEYYKNQPGLRSGKKKKERRATTQMATVAEEGEPSSVPETTTRNKLKQVFSRRKTVA